MNWDGLSSLPRCTAITAQGEQCRLFARFPKQSAEYCRRHWEERRTPLDEIKERDAEVREAIKPALNPSIRLLCKLGSIIVHAEEAMSPDGHQFDAIALKGLLSDPEVTEWLDGMRTAAFLPVKRCEGGTKE